MAGIPAPQPGMFSVGMLPDGEDAGVAVSGGPNWAPPGRAVTLGRGDQTSASSAAASSRGSARHPQAVLGGIGHGVPAAADRLRPSAPMAGTRS